ncbi:MAG: hypothetical protein QOI66_1751 [Myxococcales bacterium]|jgi:hypothetical protein|nr:hypothetical protein [Myxococcales bacterium]
MLSSRGLVLLSVTILVSCAGKSLDAVTGGDSGADNGDSAGSGGSGGAGGAGTGGAGTGGAGTGGAGTGGAGTGGAATDGPADLSGEAAGETGGGDFCAPYVYQSDTLPGVSASDFCAKVATICMFGADNSHYASMSDCLMKYGGASMAGQACRAGYLCNRTKTTLVNPFECIFAAGGGPCSSL